METLVYDTTTNQYLDDPEKILIEHIGEWLDIKQTRLDLIHREKLESGYYIYFN